MKKKLLGIALSVTLFITQTSILYAANGETNIATVTLEQPSIESVIDDVNVAESNSGYIELPEDNEVADSESSSLSDVLKGLVQSSTYPEKYPVDASGNVQLPSNPAIRNQGSYGTCWAFATSASEEFDLEKSDITENLSELHLAYFTYHTAIDPMNGTIGDTFEWNNASGTNYLQFGGNFSYAMETLLAWKGATKETDYPYSGASNLLTGSLTYDTDDAFDDNVAHLQNVYYVDMTDSTKRDEVKKMITNYGAVGVSIFYSTTYYSDDYFSYYCPDESGVNHAVTIVGWDDSFSSSNFASSSKPAGNGAWLVRNSWGGSGYSKYSYFWMSYYDASLNARGYVFDTVAATDTSNYYENNYQLDGGTFTSDLQCSNTNKVSFSNVFTAAGTEEIKAIGFELEYANTPVTVDIYRLNSDYNSPVDGTKIASVTKTVEYAGYNTIVIPEDEIEDGENLHINMGEKFSAVITIEKSGTSTIYIPVEVGLKCTYFDAEVSLQEKQSYIKATSGGVWEDLANGGAECGNLRIKAYTNDREADEGIAVEGITLDQTSASVEMGNSLQLSAKLTPSNASNSNVSWASSNESVAKVTSKGLVQPQSEGTCTITVTSADGEYQASCLITVTAIELELEMSESTVFLSKGESETLTVSNTVTGQTIDSSLITWSHTSDGIISLENGTVTALKAGTDQVTATYAGESVSASIKVYMQATATGSTDGSVTVQWEKPNATEIGYYRLFVQGKSGTRTYDLSPSVTSYTESASVIAADPAKYYYVFVFNPTDGNYTAICSTDKTYVTYPITYNLNGGTNSPYNPNSYSSSSSCLSLAGPTRSGYTFNGWYTDAALTQSLPQSPLGPINVYASWSLITRPVTSLWLNKTSVSVGAGYYDRVIAYYSPSNTTDGTGVKWTSTNTNIVTIESDGTLRGVHAGQAYVVATIGSKQTSCLVTVTGPSINYKTHVENVGWQSTVSNGTVAGTTGRNLQLESIKISLANTGYAGGVSYSSHVENIGWQSYVSNGALSGTTGRNLQIEAISIKLYGEIANYYDVYYRAHVANFGWLDWACNGAYAGSSGFNYHMEAIQIVLVNKGASAPVSTSCPYKQKLISYTTHVENIGWQSNVYDGNTAGTSGRSLRLEAIKIALNNQQYSGGIMYRTHIQNIGWESSWSYNGASSGTSGRALRLEAIQIKLYGEMANQYDVYYRVHAQNFGWLGWACNGAQAGTAGYAYRLEAIQIVLVPKGTTGPSSQQSSFKQR